MGKPSTQDSTRRTLRMSRQRRVILEALRETKRHPTAEDLHIEVRRRLPGIGLATVYRNLEVLSQHGLVRRIEPASETMRFDGDTRDHYHVRCTHCGKIEDLPIAWKPQLQQEAQMSSQYDLYDHSLVFSGVCPACKGQGASEADRD
jgi:Fur family ferric uptake transcriptional regulator